MVILSASLQKFRFYSVCSVSEIMLNSELNFDFSYLGIVIYVTILLFTSVALFTASTVRGNLLASIHNGRRVEHGGSMLLTQARWGL